MTDSPNGPSSDVGHREKTRSAARLRKLLAAEELSDRQLEALWAIYTAARRSHGDGSAAARMYAVRNRIAEHYASFVERVARETAQSYHLPDIDEFCGEVLLQLLTRIIPAYDGTSGFGPWVHACVRRRAIDFSRRRRRRGERTTDADFDTMPASDARLVEESPVAVWRHLHFAATIAGLTPSQKRLIWMHHYEGLKLREIAVKLGLPLGTVKSRVSQAVGQLRTTFAPVAPPVEE